MRYNEKPTYESLLQKADASVSQAIPKVDDTYRLQYHFMPQAYWMNDPNGLVYFQGYYHVFYQHHPYSPDWGPMHWGHARTKDFINWEHLPIALAPSEDYDADGCFSGSAVVKDGLIHIFYTGHRVIDGKAVQVQCRATSSDGVHFVKDPNNPLIPEFPPEGSSEFRDPKVWYHDGLWYMAVGSGKDGRGKVLLFKSSDLKDWVYDGVLAESDGTQGTIWECPDVFPLGDKHVLIISPIGTDTRSVMAFIGEMDYERGKFQPESVKKLDYGPSFYAPQTFFGTERRILFAWMDSWEIEIQSKKHSWAGALTLPRELSLDSYGRLKAYPLSEVNTLRTKQLFVGGVALHNDVEDLPEVDLENMGIEVILDIDLAETNADHVGIVLTDLQGGKPVTVGYSRATNRLYFDADAGELGCKGSFEAELQPKQDSLEIRIFLDRSSIEVFADKGDASLTARLYPNSFKLVPKVFARDGNLVASKVELWSLGKYS